MNKPITQRQAAFLARLGWSYAEMRNWSSDYASRVIEDTLKRKEKEAKKEKTPQLKLNI